MSGRTERGVLRARRGRAFTVLELLVVVAVLAVLGGLLFPSLVAARHAADRARTRLRFSQWVAAVEAFRAEYGAYPVFAADGMVNGGAAPDPGGEHLFHDILAGRRRDGAPLGTGPAGSAAAQNFRGIAFHSFGEAEFTPGDDPRPHLLREAAGATGIAVVADHNLDGRIDAADHNGWPAVTLPDGAVFRPGPSDIPAGGIRAGVAFFVADRTATAAAPRLVRSW